MRLHVETKPKNGSFIKELPRIKDRKDLAEVMRYELDGYELDWAAAYIQGRQIMFYDMKALIDALQYDRYE